MFRRISILFAMYFLFNQHICAGNVTDSLIYILESGVSDEKRQYEILCEIISTSPDAEIMLKYSDQAILLAEKLNKSVAFPTIYKGVGYMYAGNLSSALENFMIAAHDYRLDNNRIGLATVYMYISEAYNMQENHDNEKYYLKQAISIYRKEKDSIHLAGALHNLGYANYSMGQFDTALVLFNKTSEIYRKLGYQSEFAYCKGNSGLVFSKLGDLKKAADYLLEAMEILRETGDDYAITEYAIEYAYVLQREGRTNEASGYAYESFKKAIQNGQIEMQRDAAYRLAQLYRDMKRFDSACHYLNLFIAVNDSVKNYENVQKMADLRTEFEVRKKQSEVDVLEKNRLIQRIVIMSLIIILALVVWLMVLYYTGMKRLKRLSEALEERRILSEKQSNELKELNRIKDKFFSVISHDLRGPISSIGGISHMIKESMENNNPALLHEITEYIDQTVFSLSGLLENLLNWAQSQQGRFPFTEERIDLKVLISEVVKLFSTIAIVKDLKVELSLTSDMYMLGDRNSMMMIVRNLISNACKFTKAGGKIRIESALSVENEIIIKVSDTGVGIPEEKLSWIFEFREDKSTYGTDKEKGVGLGLNLVYEFVKLNKGTIEVFSEKGRGTTFILKFPISTFSKPV